MFHKVKKIPKLIRGIYYFGLGGLLKKTMLGHSFVKSVCDGEVTIGFGVSFGSCCGIALTKKNDIVPKLFIGDRVFIQDRVKINLSEKIEIGSGTIISWDVDILDTDFHHIIDLNNPEKKTQSLLKLAIIVGLAQEP